MSTIRVHVGGRICSPENAHISVFDRAFLFGDSVFETIGTVNGQLFALGEHLDRLERSAARIGLSPPSRVEVAQAIMDTVAAAGNAESRVRVMITRGVGPLDLDPASAGAPGLVVIVQARGGPDPKLYDGGVAVAIVEVVRNLPGALDPAVKSGNYLNNVMALREARRRHPGAHEAILCAGSGSIAEGASSNVFVVVGGQLRTPSLEVGILDGVTRGKVLGLARQQSIPTAEVDFLAADELRGAEEAFLTSAVRGVLPVTRVDGQPLGAGIPGPVTRRIMASYARLTQPVQGEG
jgi:branched-chain amino acid aminotransferase